MSEKTWPECLKCGGSTTGKLYDTTCKHDFGPEPASVVLAGPHVRWELSHEPGRFVEGERLWVVLSQDPEQVCYVEAYAHPTREGAIVGWREQVRAKARLVDALFGKLTAWAREGAGMEAAKPARPEDVDAPKLPNGYALRFDPAGIHRKAWEQYAKQYAPPNTHVPTRCTLMPVPDEDGMGVPVSLNSKEQALADMFEQLGVRVSVRETGGALPITVEATRGGEQLALIVGSRQRVSAMLHQAFERVATATDRT